MKKIGFCKEKNRLSYITKFDVILIISFLAIFLLLENKEHLQDKTEWFQQLLVFARQKYESAPLLFVGFFCLAHLISSVFALPGSCTTLNLLSGAVFGFWLGCAIVYPITMVSAVLVYFVGYKFSNFKIFSKLGLVIENQFKTMGQRDFAFLVALRLSPLFPFGIINFICGATRVPFSLYFFSTLLGVFFDVILLNNIGAALSVMTGATPLEPDQFYYIFAILFIGMVLVRFLISRRILRVRIS